MGYHLLINGVCWGYNLLILAWKLTSCDIQVFMQWTSWYIQPAGCQAMAPIHHQHQSKTSAYTGNTTHSYADFNEPEKNPWPTSIQWKVKGFLFVAQVIYVTHPEKYLTLKDQYKNPNTKVKQMGSNHHFKPLLGWYLYNCYIPLLSPPNLDLLVGCLEKVANSFSQMFV